MVLWFQDYGVNNDQSMSNYSTTQALRSNASQRLQDGCTAEVGAVNLGVTRHCIGTDGALVCLSATTKVPQGTQLHHHVRVIDPRSDTCSGYQEAHSIIHTHHSQSCRYHSCNELVEHTLHPTLNILRPHDQLLCHGSSSASAH